MPLGCRAALDELTARPQATTIAKTRCVSSTDQPQFSYWQPRAGSLTRRSWFHHAESDNYVSWTQGKWVFMDLDRQADITAFQAGQL